MLNLKKSILFALLFFTSSAFAWHEVFNTKIGQVEHGEDFVSIGGWMRAGNCLNISSKLFNGVELKAPIVLKVGMNREEFVDAMRASGILD